MDKKTLEYKLQNAIDTLWPRLSYSKDKNCPMPDIEVGKCGNAAVYNHMSRVITISPKIILEAEYDSSILNFTIGHEVGHHIHSVLNKEAYSDCMNTIDNLSIWRKLEEFDTDNRDKQLKIKFALNLIGSLTYIETIALFSEIFYGWHERKRGTQLQLPLFEADNKIEFQSPSFEKLDMRELVKLFAYMDRDNVEIETAREFLKGENEGSLLEEMVRLYSKIDRQSAVTSAIRRLIHIKLTNLEEPYRTFLFKKGDVRLFERGGVKLLEYLYKQLNEMRPDPLKENLPRKALEKKCDMFKSYSEALELES